MKDCGNIILRQLGQGNESALKELYHSFFHPLCMYGVRYVNDDEVVADIVQDIFIKVWEKRHDFADYNSLRSFMYVAVRNASLNYCRDILNRQTQLSSSHDFPVKEDIDNLDHEIISSEVRRMIAEEVDNLPDAIRTVFQMTLEDMTITQIAHVLDLSRNTVRNQRARAREILRDCLDKRSIRMDSDLLSGLLQE